MSSPEQNSHALQSLIGENQTNGTSERSSTTIREPGEQPVIELSAFLPDDESGDGLTGKYKVKVIAAKKPAKDVEANHYDKGYWDPFRERRLQNPTTDGETLTHLLKASLGTGILAMPYAFKNSGMATGIIFTAIVSLICTHCAYILVKCAHNLYYRRKITTMSFADVGEVAFANGPPWAKGFAKTIRFSIVLGIFLTYFGTCSVYAVIIAKHFKTVIDYHFGICDPNNDYVRYYILCLLVPLILLSWVPNLKYLAPVSMVANVLMGGALGITLYYLFQLDGKSLWAVPQRPDSLESFPNFFSIVIFAIEAIGVIMPLENAMKTPQHFIGVCGVLNRGMGGVTIIYILLGMFGFLRFGRDVKESIIENLHIDDIAAQIANVFIGLAVFCTFALQFFVCVELGWDTVKGHFPKRQKFFNYVVRTVLVTAAVMLAVAVPKMGPFMSLIGALSGSLVGLIIPVLIEFATFWDSGFGRFNWIVWKNVLVLIFGFMALIFGSYTSILGIIKPGEWKTGCT